jgi:hypothetical protein
VAHQAGTHERKAAGADADQRHAKLCRLAQVSDGAVVNLRPVAHRAADDGYVVELLGVREGALRRDLDAAAGAHRVQAGAHDRPAAVLEPAGVAVVRGQTERIQEQAKRIEREVV